MKKLLVYSVALVAIIGSLSLAVNVPMASAAYIPTTGDLIKTSTDSAVYYIDTDNKRHLFVNSVTFWTWYTGSWASIKFDGASKNLVTISQADFDNIDNGNNITARPGVRLIKFQNSSKTYAVSANSQLALIPDTATAESIFGSNWATKVITIQNGFENDYTKDGVLDGIKILKGWLEGTIYPLDLVLAETTESLSGYSGNKFDLIFSNYSHCAFAESEFGFLCVNLSEKWIGVGDRVRAFGLVVNNKIIIDRLEVVSNLPLNQW